MLISFICLIFVFIFITIIFYITGTKYKKPYFILYLDNGVKKLDYNKLFIISFMISIIVSISIFFLELKNKSNKKPESILAFDYVPKNIISIPKHNLKLKSNEILM